MSTLLADAFVCIHDALDDLPQNDMETLTVFERVLHQIGASAGTTKSNIVHMANVVSLIGGNLYIKSLLEEAKNAVKSIEGSDP